MHTGLTCSSFAKKTLELHWKTEFGHAKNVKVKEMLCGVCSDVEAKDARCVPWFPYQRIAAYPCQC